MQSILEGIAFRAAEVVATMNKFVSINDEISIDGGLSANPYFCQFLADVLNIQVVVRSSTELTAVGTALLAGGKQIAQNLKDSSIRRYLPETDRKEYLQKFKSAVNRSLSWRS